MRAGKSWAAVMDIVVWLRSLGLGQYEAAFRVTWRRSARSSGETPGALGTIAGSAEGPFTSASVRIDGSAWTSYGCSSRAIRGSSWLSASENVRSANRGVFTTDFRNFFLGFRVGRTLTP
jgi:hypothetical protein